MIFIRISIIGHVQIKENIFNKVESVGFQSVRTL